MYAIVITFPCDVSRGAFKALPLALSYDMTGSYLSPSPLLPGRQPNGRLFTLFNAAGI